MGGDAPPGGDGATGPSWDELDCRQQEEYADAVNSWIASEVGKRYRPEEKSVASLDNLKSMTMADTFVWEAALNRYPGMPAWTTTPAPQVTIVQRGMSAEIDALLEDEVQSVITIRFPDESVATGRSYAHPAGYDYQIWESEDWDHETLGRQAKATTIW